MEYRTLLNYPGPLDPGAQEFIPQPPFPAAPTQIFYPYTYQPHSEIQAVQNIVYPAPPPYVRADTPPLPLALPPASTTPSRVLLLSSVPTEVSESILRRDLEVYGDVRAVEMERVREGIVAVHFYDLRHAQTALVEIQEQHMQHQYRVRQHFDAVMNMNNNNSPNEVAPLSFPVPLPPPACGLVAGRAVWAQFMVPGIGRYPESYNQGTLVVFNVPPQIPSRSLIEIFEEFGCVKELREPPLKRSQRFIEFYDTRNAARAFAEMNGKEINGRHLLIEFSKPVGYNSRFPKSFNCKLNSIPNRPPRYPAFAHSKCTPWQPRVSGRNSKSPIATMASLSLKGGGGGVENRERNWKRSTGATSGGIGMGGDTNMKQQHVKSNKVGWSKDYKGSFKNEKEHDLRFLINEDSIKLSNSSDPRTTVMIKNIPNKYSQKLLLHMLDSHCIHCNEQIDDDEQPLSSYDFVYLPIDFVNKCNVGYGFVNMTSPEATLRLYKSFHHQNWEVFNSRKICQVTYARLQGLEALKEHFKSSKFPSDAAAEDYMPVVFSPPRDGRTVSNPVPITNNKIAPDDHQEGGDDDDEEEGGAGRSDMNSSDDYDNDVISGGSNSVERL